MPSFEHVPAIVSRLACDRSEHLRTKFGYWPMFLWRHVGDVGSMNRRVAVCIGEGVLLWLVV